MLVPSYAELMDSLNKESGIDDEITSRYTIVITTAKRARQLIEGAEPMVENIEGKPLSTAVKEVYTNKIKVVPEGFGTILNLKKPVEVINREREEVDVTNMVTNYDDVESDEIEDIDENIDADDVEDIDVK